LNFWHGLLLDVQHVRDLIRRDMERRDGKFVRDAILSGYRDLAAGSVFASSGDFKIS
jgi:antitoxin ParD1/3/4